MTARKAPQVALDEVLSDLRKHAKLMRKLGAKAFTIDIHGLAMEVSFDSEVPEKAAAIGFMSNGSPEEDYVDTDED